MGLFRLIELGKLALHTSIPEHLPKPLIDRMEVPGSLGLAKYITIPQLLSHTSSLVNPTSAPTMFKDVQNGVAHLRFVNRELLFLDFRHAGSNMPGWRCNLVWYTPNFEAGRSIDSAFNNREK